MIRESYTLEQQCEMLCKSCEIVMAQFYLLLNLFVRQRAYRRKGVVAELAGLSPGALTHYIKNARSPSALTVLRLADALKLKRYERDLLINVYWAGKDAATRLETLHADITILGEYPVGALPEEFKRQNIENDVVEIDNLIQSHQPLLQEIKKMMKSSKK